MTTIFLDINDEIYVIKCLTYNITPQSYKIDKEMLGLQLGKGSLSLVLQNLQISQLSKVFSKIPLQQKLLACTIRLEQLTIHWMNPIEIILIRPGDNKTHLRADIRCKWTPFSLQGENLITTNFWIPDGSPLQVRLRVTENLLAIIFIPITVQREELANLFVTLKISRTLDKRENQSLDDLLDYMDKNLGRFNEVSHINILHALVDVYDI